MSDPDDIYFVVTTDSTLISLIDGRIYPLVLPQDPGLPAITYGLVSQPMDTSQDEAMARSPKWRFKIWSDRYADLVPIATALAAIFGNKARSPWPSSRIEYPASRAEDHESDTHRYWRAMDVVVGRMPATTQ